MCLTRRSNAPLKHAFQLHTLTRRPCLVLFTLFTLVRVLVAAVYPHLMSPPPVIDKTLIIFCVEVRNNLVTWICRP